MLPDEERVQSQATRQGENLAQPPTPLRRTPQLPPHAGKTREMVRRASVGDLHRHYAAGELTVQQVVAELLAAIATLDVDRHFSVLEVNPDAPAIAAELDGLGVNPVQRPLHGIPVLIKGNIGTGDRLTTTAGAAALAGATCDRDAFIVRRLRDAGALILGKTNLSEWANYMTSTSCNGFSVLGGQTRNPHGPFDVGGSSSGAGVALALGLAPLTVGSETAGSIIYPASQNGVFGLKPSLGLVSRDRIIPISDAMDTAGPMARTVGDLALLMNALAGEDTNDPLSALAAGRHGIDFAAHCRADGLASVRIGLPRAALLRRVGDDEAVDDAVAKLRQCGADVIEIPWSPPEMDYRPVLQFGMKAGVDAYLQAHAVGAPVRTLDDVVAFNATEPADRAPFGQDLLEAALTPPFDAATYAATVQRNRTVAAETLRGAMADNGMTVLMSLSNQLTLFYAPAGFPAINIPLSRRSTGEPIGLTLVGDYGADGDLIAAAYALEAAGCTRVELFTGQDYA